MSNRSIEYDVIPSFDHWVSSTSTQDIKDLVGTVVRLADFIRAWVESGEAVRACNGDFQTYLIAVIMIIADWHEGYSDQSHLDSEGEDIEDRRPGEIFERDAEGRMYDRILDPHWFARCVFRTLHPELRLEQ